MKKKYLWLIVALFAILTLVNALGLTINIVSGLNNSNNIGIIGGADSPTIFLILYQSFPLILLSVVGLAGIIIFTVLAIKTKK